MSLSIEDQIDHLTLLVTTARKEIRGLRQEVSILKKKNDEREKLANLTERDIFEDADNNNVFNSTEEEDSDEEETQRILPRRNKTPRKAKTKAFSVSMEESSDSEQDSTASDDDAEYETPAKKRQRIEEENSEVDENSEESEIEPVDAPVGTVFKTNDGYGIFLGGGKNNIGWLYESQHLPERLRNSVSRTDLIVSDHDYCVISPSDKTVTRLEGKEAEAIIKRIRLDLVYLVDCKRLKDLDLVPGEFTSPDWKYDFLKYLEREWGVQVHFGMPSKNEASSNIILADLCEDPDSYEIDKLRKPYDGKCQACNMVPKWISQKFTAGGTTYRVGETCAQRSSIISNLLKTCLPHVFLFKFLETLHALKKLKAEANLVARMFYS
tara:strand:- start:618 stop:1760 length:1143 start_codon:yes stop_codon:yes gene_type:complete